MANMGITCLALFQQAGAVAVAEQPAVVGGKALHVGTGRVGGDRLGGPVVVLDGLGHPEVLVSDCSVRDPGVGEGHPHRAVAEERGDGLEAHASVDGLGGEGMAELVGVDVADAGTLGDRGDVAVHGAPVEGLSVVSFDESSGS